MHPKGSDSDETRGPFSPVDCAACGGVAHWGSFGPDPLNGLLGTTCACTGEIDSEPAAMWRRLFEVERRLSSMLCHVLRNDWLYRSPVDPDEEVLRVAAQQQRLLALETYEQVHGAMGERD